VSGKIGSKYDGNLSKGSGGFGNSKRNGINSKSYAEMPGPG
jgi:hypothetical protein